MYVIQRKSDGLFFKNKTCQYPDTPKHWTADLDDCNPFTTETSAKSSNGWRLGEWQFHKRACPYVVVPISVTYILK
jgi:hypothetical protein